MSVKTKKEAKEGEKKKKKNDDRRLPCIYGERLCESNKKPPGYCTFCGG